MGILVHNGTAFTDGTLKVFNGTSWVSPTAGKIYDGTSWVDFLIKYTIVSTGYSDSNFDTSTVTYTVQSLGVIAVFAGGIDYSYEWVTPTSTTSTRSHWVRVSNVVGDAGSFSGTVNTWLSLSTDQQWSLTTVDLASVQFTLDIALDSAGTNIVATGVIDLSAQRI